MKSHYLKIIFAALFIATFSTTSAASDFPASCSIDAEEEHERHQRKFNEYALGELSSVLDSCAFGDRLNNMVSGAMSSIFSKLNKLNFKDKDFFCGFGTRDVWQSATSGTSAEGTANFNAWRQQQVTRARQESGDYTQPWRRPGQSVRPVPDNIFQEIFGPGSGGG